MFSALVLPFEAFVAWKWFNAVTVYCPPDRKLLRINVDETSICLFQGDTSGTVIKNPKAAGMRLFANMTPRSKARTFMTHVAFSCDSTELQPRMPRIAICSDRAIYKRDASRLNQEAPEDIFVVRATPAWNTTMLFIRALTLQLLRVG